jgi:ferredoxin, 2Fe-2S
MKATWNLPDGRVVTADVPEGQSLMEAAVVLGIPHVTGDCGGNLACATCHVCVDAACVARTGAPGDFEDAMLDSTEAERTATSRLSCQIRMTTDLNGVVVRVPKP